MAGIDTFTSPKAQAKIDRILVELEKLRMTRDELQCLLGISKPTARRYIERLRAEQQVYIASWRCGTSGRFAPVYALGNRKDAPEPAGMTRVERNKQEWRRIKANPERHRRVKAVARVNGVVQRARATPQPWFAALVGISGMKEAA